MWGIRLTIANLVYSRMLHLQVTCVFQNQRQKRFFQFRECAGSNPHSLTAFQSLKLFRWTRV